MSDVRVEPHLPSQIAFVSLNLRLKDLLGPVTRVKKKRRREELQERAPAEAEWFSKKVQEWFRRLVQEEGSGKR